MKSYIKKGIGLGLSVLLLTACIDQMHDAADAEKVVPVQGTVKIRVNTGFVTKAGNTDFPVAGLQAVFNNFSENFLKEGMVGEDGIVSVEGLIPGIYSVSISGTVDFEGQNYYLNGSVPRMSLFEDITKEDALNNKENVPVVNIRPAKVGPLCFREIYYCGVTPYYFRDQTYEIYNNGDEVFYLDSLCFAQLCPETATTTLPVWPDEDGTDNYVYGAVVWQIPGSGRDYPLQPGESFLIVQEARDHRANNQASFDNSMAEWECWSGNAGRDNPDVPNLPYVFWHSPNTMQWLTSVFGSAFCIYKMKTPFDPDNWQTQVNQTKRYMKIAAADIMDGVELLPNMLSLDMKRIPGFVDAGAASVGSSYCGKSICRKVTGHRSDGTSLYQDTNNSTEDFEVMEHPAIRRNGEKVPAWSPSLK